MPSLHPSKRDLKFYGESIRIIGEHMAEREFNVTELCNLLGVSRVTLHRRLKTILNKPAGEFIRELRLEHAAMLLKEGECNVREAAEHSGFYNQSYFSKCFKVQFHCTPTEYLIENAKSQIPNPKQIQNSIRQLADKT